MTESETSLEYSWNFPFSKYEKDFPIFKFHVDSYEIIDRDEQTEKISS